MLRNMKICLWQNKVNSLFKFYLLRNTKICLMPRNMKICFEPIKAEQNKMSV